MLLQGLTPAEFNEAIIPHRTLGKISHRKTYKIWFDSGNQSMMDEHRLENSRLEKVDPTNEALMGIMHGVYQLNMAVIDLLLEACVFQRETAPFAGNVGANAFHLANNTRGDILGFSGTKDSQLMVPAKVSQQAVPRFVCRNITPWKTPSASVCHHGRVDSSHTVTGVCESIHRRGIGKHDASGHVRREDGPHAVAAPVKPYLSSGRRRPA